MRVKAVRLYGKNDLRLETFNLRDIEEGEVLAKVICDSVCMSTYKYAQRRPDAADVEPIIPGHEFAAEIIQAGKKVAHLYQAGDKFCAQPAMNINGRKEAPGYHFPEFGGDATHIIVPEHVLKSEYLLKFSNIPFYQAALCEPYACLLYAFASNFHTQGFTRGHTMGIRKGGRTAILGGCGPMGLGGIELMINMDCRPGMLVVTDINQNRIDYARRIISPEYASQKGVQLLYMNTAVPDPVKELCDVTGSEGFDDIYIMCPVTEVIEQADALCGHDCCINFFSGPVDRSLYANVNFFDVHYKRKHIIGSASSGVEDMKEVMEMSKQGLFRGEVMITHVGGLNCAAEVTRNLPDTGEGKKLIYTNIDMELTAIEDFGLKNDPLSRGLHEICLRHQSIWSGEAEAYLLKHGKPILS